MSSNYEMILIKDSAISKVIELSKNSLYQKIWKSVNEKKSFVNKHDEAVTMIRNGGLQAFIAEEPFLNYYKGRKKCNLVMGVL